MASQSEVGHNKNVANLRTLYQILEEMGELYNPSNEDIRLGNLTPVNAELKSVCQLLTDSIPIHRNLIADRNVMIAPLDKKCTRILNSFRSLKIDEKHKEKLLGLAQKIRGDKPKKINPEVSDEDTISTSQQSFDNRIANFDTFIAQLKSHPEYRPNEEELKTTALTTYYADLDTINKNTNAAGFAVLTNRNKRNDILYNRKASVMELQKAIKAYLLSLGAPGKPYYDAAVKLKFKDNQYK